MPPKAAAGKAKPAKKVIPEEEDKNKVPAPDKAAFDEAMGKITEAIDELMKKQQALSADIKEQSSGKEEFFQRKTELITQMQAFRAKIDSIMGRKNEVNNTMGEKKQQAIQERQQLTKMKRAVKYDTEDQIDERISVIEFKLNTETLSLKEEKDLLREIKELKGNKPQIQKLRQFEEDTKGRGETTEVLRAQIGNINMELDAYKKGKETVSKELNELMDSRKQDFENLSKLYAQRDELRKQIDEQKAKRDEIKGEFKEKEREHQAYLRELRDARYRQGQALRQAQKEENDMRRRKWEVEQLDSNPHGDTIHLIEQTIAFCKSLVATKEVEVKEAKAETQHDLPDGAEILIRKEDRDEEFFFVPTKAKKNKGKAKGPKNEGGAKPIRHNAATFALFDKLKLNAPITTEDIPQSLESLEAQLEVYKLKTKDWEENRAEMQRKIMAGESVNAEEDKAEEPAAAAADADEGN